MKPDKRYLGAIFDVAVAVTLAAIVSSVAVFIAVPLVSAGKRALRFLGIM